MVRKQLVKVFTVVFADHLKHCGIIRKIWQTTRTLALNAHQQSKLKDAKVCNLKRQKQNGAAHREKRVDTREALGCRRVCGDLRVGGGRRKGGAFWRDALLRCLAVRENAIKEPF